MPAGRKIYGRNYKENEFVMYKSSEKKLTPDKRKRLYSEVFDSIVKAPMFRTKYDEFHDFTPILYKAVSGDPSCMPVELLRNKCIVIYCVVLISRIAYLATLQPYMFT